MSLEAMHSDAEPFDVPHWSSQGAAPVRTSEQPSPTPQASPAGSQPREQYAVASPSPAPRQK